LEKKNIIKINAELLPKNWQMLFERGWKIEPTSCVCGGSYAWLKPRPSGAYDMFGCICHTTPSEKEILKTLPEPKGKSVDLDELQGVLKKTLSLLEERQPGLMSWNGMLEERLNDLNRILP